jgi:hypothetical protein
MAQLWVVKHKAEQSDTLEWMDCPVCGGFPLKPITLPRRANDFRRRIKTYPCCNGDGCVRVEAMRWLLLGVFEGFIDRDATSQLT